MSHGRQEAAVPFVGKDTPSPMSEFAHPDVVMGLTALAMWCVGHAWHLRRGLSPPPACHRSTHVGRRHGGMRMGDFKRLMSLLLAKLVPHGPEPEAADEWHMFKYWVQHERVRWAENHPTEPCPEVRRCCCGLRHAAHNPAHLALVLTGSCDYHAGAGAPQN